MNIPKPVAVALEVAAAAAVGVTLAGIGVGFGLAAIVAVKLLSNSSSPESDEKPDPLKQSNPQFRNDKKAPMDEEKQPLVTSKNPPAPKERSASSNVPKNTDSLPPMPLTPPALPKYIGSTVNDAASLPVRKPSVVDKKKEDLPTRNTEASRRAVEQRIPTGVREWRATVNDNKGTKNGNGSITETRVDRDEPKYPPAPVFSDLSSDNWLHVGGSASLTSSSQEKITSHESAFQIPALVDVFAEPTITATVPQQISPFDLIIAEPFSLTTSIVTPEADIPKNVDSNIQPVAEQTQPVEGPMKEEKLPASILDELSASIPPLPELPPSNTNAESIPQLPLSSRAKEKQRDTSFDVTTHEPAISSSPPMDSSFMSAVTTLSESESPEPPSSDAWSPSTSPEPDSILQGQPSVVRKRRPSMVASAAKKVSNSVKGAFKDSNASNDSISSGKEGLKGYTTSPSRDSLASNKSGRSMLSGAKDGVKRMFSTKDKSRSATPSSDSVLPSDDTPQQGPRPSSPTPEPDTTPSRSPSKKKQRQQSAGPDAGNASPMLKGMFKGRKQTKTSA